MIHVCNHSLSDFFHNQISVWQFLSNADKFVTMFPFDPKGSSKLRAFFFKQCKTAYILLDLEKMFENKCSGVKIGFDTA